ncbi:MAG: hypothetical protein WCL23_01400 [Candidatus Moraniibacteriota bacterium]
MKPKNSVGRLKFVHFSYPDRLATPAAMTAVGLSIVAGGQTLQVSSGLLAGSSFQSDTRPRFSGFFTERVTNLWSALKRNFRMYSST